MACPGPGRNSNSNCLDEIAAPHCLPPGLRTRPTPSSTSGFYDLRNGVQRWVCPAAILSHSCPLWVKSRHRGYLKECPLYPQKRTLKLGPEMSALCQKRTSTEGAPKLEMQTGVKGTL